MLRDMINESSFCIADEDPRVVLTGALLEVSEGRFTMVALDGFRMAYKREKCSDVLDRVCAIVPGRAVGDLGKRSPEETRTLPPSAFENGRHGGSP